MALFGVIQKQDLLWNKANNWLSNKTFFCANCDSYTLDITLRKHNSQYNEENSIKSMINLKSLNSMCGINVFTPIQQKKMKIIIIIITEWKTLETMKTAFLYSL